MKINGKQVNFDIEHYLSLKNIQYHLVGHNAMLCCPFHKESNPSFGIDIITGVYNCFSGSCGARGNIVNFTQKIEGLSTYENAEQWIFERYSFNTEESCSILELDFGNEKETKRLNYINDSVLKQYDYRHPYLGGRGIGELWQERFRIGYDKNNFAITMPWYGRQGKCVGIKYRSVIDKHFWVYHENEVGPNKITLFGINHAFRRKERRIVIVESEIDAIYCWQCGFPAVALGTSHITRAQINELKNTYVEAVLIATDNDEAGRNIAKELEVKLSWISDIYKANWSMYPSVKDVNELTPEKLIQMLENPALAILE
jgi:DNA primase